jgi:uncharacterized cupredoxin-like copper-binding protein
MSKRTGARWLCVLAIGLAAVPLSACSDDESGSATSDTAESTATTESGQGRTGGGASLAVDAVERGPGKLAFSKDALSAKAGAVTVRMRNPQRNQLPHAIEIEGEGIEEEGETVQAGGSSTVTVDLKPGKYEFYCPVGNHEQQGMEGTLTVR